MSASPQTTFSLTGKSIVVTGGSGGIGAEIVKLAATHGAKEIVVGYSSNADAVKKLIDSIKGSSTKFHAVQGRLVDQKSCAAFIKEATEQLSGKIDGLVLAAGIMPMTDLAHSTDENLALTFDSNVKATLFTIQAALPHIVEEGSIITFSTSVNNSPQALTPGYLHYSMCKAAIEQMTKCLQRDPTIGGPERRIRVNCVAPGATATELFLRGKTDEIIKRIGSTTTEGRIGQPDEVAEAILFLLTPASRWIRGQLLRINGAQTL